MKNIIFSGVLSAMLIISFAHGVQAQVVSTTTDAVVISADDRASIVAEIESKLRDLLMQLIAQLQDELKAMVVAQVASSTSPVLGSVINSPAMANTSSDKISLGQVSVVNGEGVVPIVVNDGSYVSGVARIKGHEEGNAGYGVSWGRGGTVPKFEGLIPDTYDFTIRLYNKPYSETQQGTTTDFTAETIGSFVVPKQ